MTSAGDFLRNLYSDIETRVDRARAFRAVAQGTQSAGLITIKRLESTSNDGQPYARLEGFTVSDQDNVACVETRGGGTLILGTIQNTAPAAVSLDAGLIGEVIQAHVSQDAADNPTIVATTTYQVLCTTAITLPAGTWNFRVALDLRATQGSSGNVSLKINVGGTASGTTWTGGSLSAARTLAVINTAPGSWVGMSTGITGIAGGGVVNVFAGGITPGGGTMTANGPRMLIDAVRTA